MIKIEVKPWKEQDRDDTLGMIIHDKPLFRLKNPTYMELEKKLKDKQIKSTILKDRLLVGWTGQIEYYDADEKIRILAAQLSAKADSYGIPDLCFLLNTSAGANAAPWILQGIMLGRYRFDKYKKSEDNKDEVGKTITFLVDQKDVKKVRKELETEYKVLSATDSLRDMTNEPGNVIYPESAAKTAEKLAAEYKLDCEVIKFPALKKNGYNGHVNVGKGSGHPPCMVVLRYNPPRKSKAHLALVGKGITFDAGGYCLKPPGEMWEMKTDMTGAATVLYTMRVIAERKIPLRVTAILCLAENLISGDAYRPGDIFRAKNGKTIHVGNTDAEGRLVLTDGLFRAGEEKATHIVDIATLTGSCVVALGMHITALFSNDSRFKNMLLKASEKTGENFWELPMHEEYLSMMKSPYADLSNIGDRKGGTIQAALFLREFVPENTSWIHLDIAGTSFTPKPWKYFKEGATGIGLRTLVNLAEKLAGRK